MLHIITENNELKNRTFPLPDGVRKILAKTLSNYNGDKTVDGYKRLNNILEMDTISFQEMKRLKNFFDNYRGTDKSTEYILNGGDAMKTWVNNTLYTATKAVHDFKQAKKDAGIDNAFIKHHTKDRQNKRKNKPTQAKFDTKDMSNKMMTNNSLKYESILRESIDIEDYMYDYDERYVLDCFLHSKKGERQNWGVLINPSMYQKALTEFTKFGELRTFPSKYVYQWIGILFRNTFILQANTNLVGHSEYFPSDAVEEFCQGYLGDKFYDLTSNDEVCTILSEKEFVDLCSKEGIYLNESAQNGVHKNGQYDLFMNQEETDEYDKEREMRYFNEKYFKYIEMADKYNEKISNSKIKIDSETGTIYHYEDVFNFLDSTGLYDWMEMPDGSEAWSDYGLKPIFEILKEYNDNMSPEEILVLVNRTLDVYHMRGDLSSIFIQGGTKSLSAISNGGIAEGKKVVVITESQKRKLLEAMDDTFDFAELSNIRSFNGRVKYCKKHLGQPIGRGSSRMTFQIDDENVLKLAWNEKGVGQNIEEERAYGDDIFPTVSKSDDNGLWLVSEFVLPAKAQDFKHCFGMTFREFCNFIGSCGKYRFGMRTWQQMPEEQWIEYLENNEQLAAFDDYIGNYGKYVVGDMMRMCNYGLTNRNGEPTIVLLDSGLTEDIYNTFYKRR